MDDKESLRRAARDGGPITRADIALVEASRRIEDHPVTRAVGKASELADQPPLVTACLVTTAIGLLAKDHKLARTGFRMLAAHALATQVKTVVKDNIDRPRPAKVERDGEHEIVEGDSKDGEDRSLPSGHSAGAVAVARAIGRSYPRAAPWALGIAGLAALVQIPRKAHFASDVVAGSLIGLASEALVAGVVEPVLDKAIDAFPPAGG